MRGLLWTAVLIAGSAGSALSQVGPAVGLVSIAETENCPVEIQSAVIDPGPSTGLRVRYVVTNRQGKRIDRLVLTAATVNRDHRVTAVRVQSVEAPIDARGRSEQFVVFPRLAPFPDERVVFGVQAVGWSGGKEWRGVVRLARIPAGD